MTKTIALIVAIVFASGSAFAQQQASNQGKRFEEVPQNGAAQKQPDVDHAAKAKKRLADWTDTKVPCYRAITGATEGVHWRVNPANPSDIETHSSLWNLPASVTGEFAKCKAKQPGQ